MITYLVKYKQNGIFKRWKTLKNVKGDGIMQENPMIRFFILEDESRLEIPMNNYVFKFSKERFFSIQKRMSEEAGQDVKINKR